MFLSANAGKRSLGLSLRDPRGRDALLRLAARADVFLQSLRPGLAEELGLGPDAVRAANPRLVYCSLGAYGHTGPLAREAGVRRADAGGRRAHLDHGRAGATRRPGRLVAHRPGDGHVGGARRPRSAARARADGRGLRRRRLPVRDGDRLHRLPPGRLPRGRHDPERRGNPLPDGRPVPGDGDAGRRAAGGGRQRPPLRRDLRRPRRPGARRRPALPDERRPRAKPRRARPAPRGAASHRRHGHLAGAAQRGRGADRRRRGRPGRRRVAADRRPRDPPDPRPPPDRRPDAGGASRLVRPRAGAPSERAAGRRRALGRDPPRGGLHGRRRSRSSPPRASRPTRSAAPRAG